MTNIKLRDPKQVMKLSRLGSFHQSKLSFLRSFIREFRDWNFQQDLFDLDSNGYGTAIYSVRKEKRVYSLICFANELDPDKRSDRVIATKWDAAFVLHDGIPTNEDIERLRENVPKQEVGRLTYKELTLSRANKSIRIFDHVVENLSNGKQPNMSIVDEVGYLYRTTAVYGSGKFGLADRYRIKDRPEINGPFRLEMMLVYLVRQFTFDQVNHIAKLKSPQTSVELDQNIARRLGIGNSTGLGMAPFIVNHPSLLHKWIFAREEALRQIRSIEKVSLNDFQIFKNCLHQSKYNIETWNTKSDYQNKKIEHLKLDLEKYNIKSIIWATGYTQDFSWLKVDTFDDTGKPLHVNGVSKVSGVYFIGLPWLSMRGSSFIWGIWQDAKNLAEHIAQEEKTNHIDENIKTQYKYKLKGN